MNELEKLQKRLKELIEEGDNLIKVTEGDEARSLTDDESTRLDEIRTESREVREKIALIKHRDAWEQEQRAAQGDVDFVPGARATEVVEDRRSYHQWPVDEADQYFRAVSTLAATRNLPSGMQEELRETFTEALEQRAPTGQGTLIDSEGGFLVPSTISSTILQKINTEGQIVSRTQAVPITVGNTAEWNAIKENARTSGNRYGGITVARKGEAVAPDASKAKFDHVKMELKDLTALVYVTNRQLEDGPQLRTVINELVPKAITFKTEDEILNGDGTTQMQGILNAPCTVEVSKETGQAADTVLYENIVKMYARLHLLAPGAVFLINQDVLPQLFTMSMAVGTGGVPVYLPANGAAGSPFGTLLGRPIIPVEHCPTVGDSGDIVLADLGQYLYATKGGVRSAASIHVKFLEGETAFRFMLRNDGKSWWPSALTPAKGSATQSPFIKLAARA